VTFAFVTISARNPNIDRERYASIYIGESLTPPQSKATRAAANMQSKHEGARSRLSPRLDRPGPISASDEFVKCSTRHSADLYR
jgi:hypothetical protein